MGGRRFLVRLSSELKVLKVQTDSFDWDTNPHTKGEGVGGACAGGRANPQGGSQR